MKHVLLPVIALLGFTAHGQLVIDNATFFIGEGATVTVQGDLTTNTNIQAGGTGATRGKIAMKGSAQQTINAGANVVIPRLEIDNTNNVVLGSDLRIGNRIDFVAGKLRTAANHLIVPDNVEFAGMTASRFIETDGTGTVRQLTPANMVNPKVIPIGNGNNFSPVSYQLTGASGLSANSYVAVRSTGTPIATPARHPRTESFLNTAWVVSGSGYTAGNIAVTGTYADAQLASGSTEADLRGMWWNGTAWNLTGGGQNAGSNSVSATVPGTAGGTVYGMNRFVLARATAFLHGPFNANGLMNDNLRANNLIPLSDPYRAAPFNYPHATNGNSVAETISSSVLSAHPNPDSSVVDWVLVELMNNNTPATVIQSRSGLILRNGAVVDIDGRSPIYFKNVDGGNYNISVRHRNHIGAMTPAVVSLGLNNPTPHNFIAASNAAFNNPSLGYTPLRSMARTSNTDVWGLYSGDGNFNKRTQTTGSPTVNDYSLLLNNLTLTPGYHQRDYNMDGTTRNTGSPTLNDYSRLLNSLNGRALTQQHEK